MRASIALGALLAAAAAVLVAVDRVRHPALARLRRLAYPSQHVTEGRVHEGGITGIGHAVPAALPPRPWGPLTVWTLAQLAAADGTNDPGALALAVAGRVFDVSAGARFYGPGTAYGLFAGRAATRALVIGSLDRADVSDDMAGVSYEKVVQKVQFYAEKYPQAGVLAGGFVMPEK